MNVLSLFDGMSCGQIALNKAGIKYENYFASEIKPFAIKCTQFNYPDTIQLGDVRDINANDLPKIDLFIGGSPCQDFSQANRVKLGLEGEKSGLFYEYLRLLNEVKPKYFLLENVAMDDYSYQAISEMLGTYPVNINSELVSAQLRQRSYWTNIGPEYRDLLGFRYSMIPQPKDKKIKFQSVLDCGYTERVKARALLEGDSRPNVTPVKIFHRHYAKGFHNAIFKSKKHYLACVEHYEMNYKGTTADDIDIRGDNSVYESIRYINTRESERLQTVPEGYTDCVKPLEALSLLGDGWTVDVIAHIFSFLDITN